MTKSETSFGTNSGAFSNPAATQDSTTTAAQAASNGNVVVYNQVVEEVRRLQKAHRNRVDYLVTTLGITASTARILARAIQKYPQVPAFEIGYNPQGAYVLVLPEGKNVPTVNQAPLDPVPVEDIDYKFVVCEDLILTPAQELEWKARNYFFNVADKTYVVRLKSLGNKWVTFKEWQHEALMNTYCNNRGEAKNITDITYKFGLPRNAFDEYKRIFKWTHNSLPVTDEKLKTRPVQEIVNDLYLQKRMEIQQAFNKRDWEETQEDARKWREFKALTLDPFEHVVSKFNPTPLNSEYVRRLRQVGPLIGEERPVFLIGLSDVHFGAKADPKELVYSGYNSLEETVRKVKEYGEKIAADVKARGGREYFKKGVLCVLGDILHSITGETSNGTPLDFDKIGHEQFDAALESCEALVQTLVEIFGVLDVHVVKGNHAGMDEYHLFQCIQKAMRNDPRVRFYLEKAKTHVFVEGGNAIFMEHGASDYIKAKIPNGVDKRKAYIQDIILEHKSKLPATVKTNLWLQGDQHHYEQLESNNYEYFMFGTMMTGDKFADHINKHSRARQNCLVLNQDGVKEALHYFFD